MVKERTLPVFQAASAQITKEEGLKVYEDMVLGRLFEDKCAEMYYRGKMFGFVHLYNGQEAVSSGVVKAMRPGEDYVCSTYRDHVHALSAGVPAREVMAELFGKATGCSKGRGGSMHMFSSPHRLLGGYAFVAEGIPVATGAAFQSKYRKETMGDANADQVTACFFGDGACNNGQFFECLNMAALWKLPILYVVENNKWAIGMAHERATSDPEIYKKAHAFGMAGVEVDGMDALAVYQVAKEAIARARAGEVLVAAARLVLLVHGHAGHQHAARSGSPGSHAARRHRGSGAHLGSGNTEDGCADDASGRALVRATPCGPDLPGNSRCPYIPAHASGRGRSALCIRARPVSDHLPHDRRQGSEAVVLHRLVALLPQLV